MQHRMLLSKFTLLCVEISCTHRRTRLLARLQGNGSCTATYHTQAYILKTYDSCTVLRKGSFTVTNSTVASLPRCSCVHRVGVFCIGRLVLGPLLIIQQGSVQLARDCHLCSVDAWRSMDEFDHNTACMPTTWMFFSGVGGVLDWVFPPIIRCCIHATDNAGNVALTMHGTWH